MTLIHTLALTSYCIISLNIFTEFSLEFITSNLNNAVRDVLDLDGRILSIAAPIISYSPSLSHF